MAVTDVTVALTNAGTAWVEGELVYEYNIKVAPAAGTTVTVAQGAKAAIVLTTTDADGANSVTRYHVMTTTTATTITSAEPYTVGKIYAGYALTADKATATIYGGTFTTTP